MSTISFDALVSQLLNKEYKFNELYSLLTTSFRLNDFSSDYVATLTQSFFMFLLSIKGMDVSSKKVLLNTYLRNFALVVFHPKAGIMHDNPENCPCTF